MLKKALFSKTFLVILLFIGFHSLSGVLSDMRMVRRYNQTLHTSVKVSAYESITLKLDLGGFTLLVRTPFKAGYGHGSGVFVRKDGVILTAAHVAKHSPYFSVITADKKYHNAVRIAMDEENDLGLLKIVGESTSTFKVAKIGVLRPSGWPVYAVGSPLSFSWLITSGIISQYDENMLISDTVINPGSSGGGLYDSLTGRLIGITVGTSGPINRAMYQGHSVSVPADIIKKFLERSLPLCG